MTAKTIYYLITVLELYIFSVGAYIYIMRYETLSPKAAKLYKIIISVDIILSSLFLIKYFTMDNKNVHNYVSTSLDITIVIWILEVIIIAFKGISNTTKPVQRESFDLKEEFLTEENVKICYSQRKKENNFKGTIVFMHPDYYKSDLNGRVWYQNKRKKRLLGHIGKYDEISDFFVRAGYHTLRYDHSDIETQIPIQPVLQTINKVLKERNSGRVIVFCAGNINDFIGEIVEGLNPTELICIGITNRDTLNYINRLKERMPIFIGDFGDDPYCNVKNENAIHFENTDFTFCVRGKRKLKKYGRSADNEGITDVGALEVIKGWLI